MKIHRLLDNYLHSQVKKSAGDWDDIANAPDIIDSLDGDSLKYPDNTFNMNEFNTKLKSNNVENVNKKKLDIIV